MRRLVGLVLTLLLMPTLAGQPPNDEDDALHGALFFDGLMAYATLCPFPIKICSRNTLTDRLLLPCHAAHSGLGTPIGSARLRDAIGQRCELRFAAALHELRGAFSQLNIVDAPPAGDGRVLAILENLQALSRALRIFSAANYRCNLLSAGNVAQAAATLQSLDESSTSQTGAGQRPQLFIAGLDVSPSLRRAGEALKNRRFYQAGLTFAQVFVATAGEMDDQPSLHDKWAPMDAQGRIKGEDELAEHWRALHTKRLEALLDAERRLAAGAPPERPQRSPAATTSSRGSEESLAGAGAVDDLADYSLSFEECCCCWAEVTAVQEGTAHAAHLY